MHDTPQSYREYAAQLGAKFLESMVHHIDEDCVYSYIDSRWDSESADRRHLREFVSCAVSRPRCVFEDEADYAYKILLSLELAANSSADAVYLRCTLRSDDHSAIIEAAYVNALYLLCAFWFKTTVISEHRVLQMACLGALHTSRESLAYFNALLSVIDQYSQDYPLDALELDRSHVLALQYCCCVSLADLAAKELRNNESNIVDGTTLGESLGDFLARLADILSAETISAIKTQVGNTLIEGYD